MRAARRVIFATAVVLLASSCGSGSLASSGGGDGAREVCTQELGVHIEPRALTLAVGEREAISVETSTCGGTIRGTPEGLRLTSRDPGVARVGTHGRIEGVAPGGTTIEVSSSRFGSLGSVSVTVVA